MRRWITTALMLAACTAVVRADVTITQTTSVEGGPAAMAGGTTMPKTTTRIKGMKQRTDIDVAGQSLSTIVDLTTKQVAILMHNQKTVRVVTAAASDQVRPQIELPKMDASLQPTGRSQVIDGIACDEYLFTTTVDMGSMAGSPQMPPEAAAMMQGATMTMKGSVWVAKSAPGAAEYAAFTSAASKANLTSLISGAAATGNNGTMERMMNAMSKLNGLAYMTEMTMSVDGTGQFVDMMKQMGDMHVTTKVSSISTDPIDDSVFVIPSDYTVTK